MNCCCFDRSSDRLFVTIQPHSRYHLRSSAVQLNDSCEKTSYLGYFCGGCSIVLIGNHQRPGHSFVTGTSRNDFFPGCFLAPGFLSGKNRRIPIGSYRFQKSPAGDRLESYRNCPKTSDRNPAAKNQSKTARKGSEAVKTGGIRHGNRRNGRKR